ncbi:MAG: protein kinase [Planctomycetaceae bacterium]
MRFLGAQEYELISPLRSGRIWSSFVASAGGESLVELRVLDTDVVPEAEQRQELHRLQLLAIVEHPGLRKIIDLVPDHEPPFVVVERLNLPSADDADDRGVQDCHRLFDALACAHRFGVVAGPFSVADLRMRAAHDWILDLTDARTQSDYESILPPEQRSVDVDNSADPEGDVYSLSAILSERVQSLPDSVVTDRTSLLRLLARGMAFAPDARPSARQLALELSNLASADIQLQIRLRKQDSQLEGMIITEPTVEDPYSPTLAESASSAMPAPIPKQLGRFRLHERLGAGAAGTVYRATDCSNNENVALKILNSTVAQNPSMLRRFTREARLLAQVGSPYVARLLDTNSDQGLHFLAIEFISGGTLSCFMRNSGRLDERKSLRLMLDVISALTVAHQQSIIHRDIKPENILLTAAGQSFLDTPEQAGTTSGSSDFSDAMPFVKLSDFGLARADSSSESMAVTQDGAILGTPLYMSPEQCRGTAADTRSDIYSVGATLFHMLAGRPPFQGDNPVALMNAHCHDPIPPLRQLRAEISDGCIAVVEKCLAKNPDARFSDAAALLADLERLLHGEPTSMVLHPATPATNGLDVMEFPFSCDLSSSPGQLWPFISNTDRVNHALGLPTVSYTTRTDPTRGVERFAESKIAGQKIVWQEHPYEWIEGRRLSVLREFSTGPFLWFMNIIEMQSISGGGTRVNQTLKVVPRNWFGGVLARLTLGRSTPQSFRRVYQQIDTWLSRPENAKSSADAFGTTGAMTATGRTRLSKRLEHLSQRHIDPAVVETLRQFLEHASDPEVARIRPLMFAERFQLPPKDVIDACLFAAKEGILTLLWDILCPSCRIPADVQETLATLKEHGYCPSCDLRYEINFANSVELIFRSHPEIRTAETRTYCIGGPAFSAHVVAQTRLMPGERFEMELMLTEGSYRLRGPQLPFAVDMRVSAAAGVTRFELPLLRPPLPNSVPALRHGNQVLTLFNNTTRELQVRLERTADRSMALTAAAAASMPIFREMFPNEVLAPGQIVSVTNITLLMAEICGANELYHALGDGPAFGKIRTRLLQVDETIKAHGGAIVKIVGDGVFATFQNSESAIGAIAALLTSASEPLPLRMALHRSSALVTTLNDRLDYFGEALHLLRTMLQMAEANELILTASVLPIGDADLILHREGLLVVPLERIIADTAIVAYRCQRI